MLEMGKYSVFIAIVFKCVLDVISQSKDLDVNRKGQWRHQKSDVPDNKPDNVPMRLT